MDIEGYEQQAVCGMKKLLKANPRAILLICVYHQSRAEKEIRNLLESSGYQIIARKGKMFFQKDAENGYGFRFLRRGVLECERMKK